MSTPKPSQYEAVWLTLDKRKESPRPFWLCEKVLGIGSWVRMVCVWAFTLALVVNYFAEALFLCPHNALVTLCHRSFHSLCIPQWKWAEIKTGISFFNDSIADCRYIEKMRSGSPFLLQYVCFGLHILISNIWVRFNLLTQNISSLNGHRPNMDAYWDMKCLIRSYVSFMSQEMQDSLNPRIALHGILLILVWRDVTMGAGRV